MDLTGYKLVFEDNFEGDALDTSKWDYRGTGAREGGIYDPDAVSVRDGKLTVRFDYRKSQYGEGWHTGQIKVNRRFCRGYFETRCICSAVEPWGDWDTHPWCAFWIQADHPYEAEISRGGPGGAEIDIFEAMGKTFYPGIVSNIHLAGKSGSDAASKGQLDSKFVGGVTIPDLYTNYHTYALEWTDKVYRFYVDGFCYAESSWGDGVSEVEEELIVSLELPAQCNKPHGFYREFVVDYVRVWQKED